MTTPDPDTVDQEKHTMLIDLPRLGLVAGTAIVILGGLYLGSDVAARNGNETVLFGYGFLLLVPFVATLMFVALCRVYWASAPNKQGLFGSIVATVLAIVLLLLSLALPFLVCLAIAAPLWLVGAFAGALASQLVIKRSITVQIALILSLVASTAGVLALESGLGYPVNRYTVTRSAEVAASPDEIWPHLLELANFQADERRWNFSQDVLGIPRPVAAIVHGEGVGAIRTARWQRDVWFEEHVTGWKPGELIEWEFVFPEGSTFTAIDQHIDPRGPNLVVETGGYRLTPLGNGSTRLDVFTTYKASTAVNAYSSLWGELVIGDVQDNILAIIKGRAGSTTNEPGAAPSLIAIN